ncbi:type II secretion system protein [Candidatus Saccharibacteria bacterium]|nr:type II secretion system protein [Candidatus Saccharibacteria bacterium]MBQ9016676.1 type II secretion system protein [Candidatus Saccharibacteria bacterium]
MLKQKTLSKRGFTIIEVVLVLAIAGLIFLMVFLALPALQRSQKDTQRRNSLGEFRTQIVQYQSNNNGRLPGYNASDSSKLLEAWQKFVINYMDLGYVSEAEKGEGEESNDGFFELNENAEKAGITDIPFIDPDGEPIYIGKACDMERDSDCEDDGKSMLNWNANKHEIYIYMKAGCDGENAVPVATANTRSVAFRYKLEGAGIYCGNN